MYRILFIHLPVDGHLGHFYFLAITNNAMNNTYTYLSTIFLCRCIFSFLNSTRRDKPRIRVVAFYGNSYV